MKQIFLASIMALTIAVSSNADQASLRDVVDTAMKDGTETSGYSLHVSGGGNDFAVAVGYAAPDKTPLGTEHMFRIASITKSYVAASALRLVEQGRFDLEASIKNMIDPAFDAVLTRDGYDTSAITLQQVMSHTAGFYDHAQSQKYIEALFSDPQHVWSRAEQVQMVALWGDPVGAPGEKFFYSDTGFVLLGQMIERETGSALPLAVRALLDLNRLELTETAWERGDSEEIAEGRRAHQYLAGKDTYRWDPSVDLYGGGGLVATPGDVARFYSQLFGGQVFARDDTLGLMLSDANIPAGSPYRLGVFVKDYDGLTVYEHGGFWGTLVFYDPKTKIAIAGAALRQEDYPKLQKAMVTYLKGLN